MTSPTFGSTLRGLRLGFRWLSDVSAFVRVSGEPGRWVVELVREAKDLPSHPALEAHRCWWESEGAASDLAAALTRPAGAAVAHPKPPCRLVLGDDGQPLLKEAAS